MQRKTLLLVALILALAAALAGIYFSRLSRTPAGQERLTKLTAENFSDFQSGFDAAAAGPRLVLLLSPT
jgi:hypothetical protein